MTEPAKLILPYLQRADELQKHEPLVAYYCRLFAMARGLKIPSTERTKTTDALLVSLMNQLEKDKKSVKLGADDHLYVEGFALNVFSKADKQDRAGRADVNTAKTFYAASIFFDILHQFGELQPDLEQKRKYAAWKAADIRKALSEGRQPLPGPPGGESDHEPSSTDDIIRPDKNRIDQSSTSAPDSDSSPQQYDKTNLQHPHISPQPSNITLSSSSNGLAYNQCSDNSYPNLPPSNTESYPLSVSKPSSTTRPEYEHDSNYQPPVEQIAEAHKAARFAVSALAFDDVPVAVSFLKKSLDLLTKPLNLEQKF